MSCGGAIRAAAPAAPAAARAEPAAARRGLLLHLAAGGSRRRLRLRRVLALVHDEALATVRLRLPLLAQLGVELVVGGLLVARLQLLADRRGRLLQRLLLGRRDLLDLEDVVAELDLDRAAELALVGREQRRVEVLLLRALGDAQQLAALALGGVVDRVALGDGRPALIALERLQRGVGVGLGLRQHEADVARLGLREARLVLLVERRDGLVGHLVGALDGLLAQLRVDGVEGDLEARVGDRHARLLEELLEVGLLREGVLDGLLVGLVVLLRGDLDALLARPRR